MLPYCELPHKIPSALGRIQKYPQGIEVKPTHAYLVVAEFRPWLFCSLCRTGFLQKLATPISIQTRQRQPCLLVLTRRLAQRIIMGA